MGENFRDVATVVAVTLLNFSEDLPYLGPVAKSINRVVHICGQCKCNKEDFDKLKERLSRFDKLLSKVAREFGGSDSDLLQEFTRTMETVLDNAIKELEMFTKKKFLGRLAVGIKPEHKFKQLDEELTKCLIELNLAIQLFGNPASKCQPWTEDQVCNHFLFARTE